MSEYFEELILELQWEAMRIKAKGVLRKCMVRRKYKLAMKIASKYSLQLPQHDDTVTALAMASYSINPKT